MAPIDEEPLESNRRAPLLLRLRGEEMGLPAFVGQNRALVARRLLEHGAILFRGFGVLQPEAFSEFVAALAVDPLEYNYRSTPRTSRGRGLYTATEYPASREIPLHNENSYQRVWPRTLAFCCLSPASSGGATPLADGLEVRRLIDHSIFEKFRRLGVQYDRVFHGHVDLSWQDAFQTADKARVARFCAENQIQYEWLDEDILKTSQVCQGVARHDERGEEFLFNQAHLFHPSALGDRTLRHMLDAFGPELLPRNAFYGDGTEIESTTFAAIRAAYAQAAVDLCWEAGDVALIDNIQIAHGRRAYSGDRRLLAALLEPNRPPLHE